jgi:hypothetical protein
MLARNDLEVPMLEFCVDQWRIGRKMLLAPSSSPPNGNSSCSGDTTFFHSIESS